LILKVGLEHNDWKLSSQIGLPCVGILHGDQIDLVENDDDFFVGHRLNFSFNIFCIGKQADLWHREFREGCRSFQ